jgi:hypothetical protein
VELISNEGDVKLIDTIAMIQLGKVDGKTVKRQYERVHRKDNADGLRLLQKGI